MPEDDTDLRFQFRDGFLYYERVLYIPKGHVDFGCFSLDTIFHQRDILVSTKPWSLFLETFGGHKCGNQSKNLSQRMTSVPV